VFKRSLILLIAEKTITVTTTKIQKNFSNCLSQMSGDMMTYLK